MRVHVLQHVPFEGPGSILPWLEARAARISYTRLFAGERMPGGADMDALIAMGGPMSVNDEAELPWLRAEKQLVRDAIGRDIPVLGVCLGAQLIASALGARVYHNPVKEIGWFPIRAVAGGNDVFHFPAECTVFHWHGDTFDLPEGAVRLAESAACSNQAFQLKRNVIALQFHPEMTPDIAHAITDHCLDELVSAPCVATEHELRAVPSSAYREGNDVMSGVLAYLFDEG